MDAAVWDSDSTELVRKMYLMPSGVEILAKMLSLTPQQIINKAWALGLRRKQLHMKEYVKVTVWREPNPTPPSIAQGKCPRCGGMILYERLPGIGYDAWCICGGRFPLRS